MSSKRDASSEYGFFFDQSRCYGCKACSVACKDWYDIAPGPEKWMSVYMWEKGAFPNTQIGILAFSCGHCGNPVCVGACEHGAIFKEDKYGAVLGEKGIAIEAGPFDPPLAFDRPLGQEDADVFRSYGDAGAQLRIMFLRGPAGERFEVLQDNIAAL